MKYLFLLLFVGCMQPKQYIILDDMETINGITVIKIDTVEVNKHKYFRVYYK